MTQLTKADAARQLGISRTTLYTCIDQGQLSATPKGLIDQTELVRAHIARLTAMLHEAHQQNQRLLALPSSALQPRPSPGPLSTPRLEAPRGDLRRRIVALRQAYPEGLTPAEMQTLLGVDKSLADTCLGMLRYGLV
jgi:hypothetical protein